ncbi:hypothetical protein [Corynebacterium glaucum]|nr:hypothetical protein [Corynebacterium glaucum]
MFTRKRLAPACIAVAVASAAIVAPAANAVELQVETRSGHSLNAVELSSALIQPYKDLSSLGSSEYFFPSPENRTPGNPGLLSSTLGSIVNLVLPFYALFELTGSSIK